MPQDVIYFLQRMNALKLICEYLCAFKCIVFKLSLSLLQAYNSLLTKTSMWAASEQSTRFGLTSLCLSVLCLKGFKYCTCVCVCCQNWTHCHHLDFNFPITTAVRVEAFFFLKWAHVGSRRTVLQQN